LDRENTYTLNFIVTRKDAAIKDGVRYLDIYLPTVAKRNFSLMIVKSAYNICHAFDFLVLLHI